MIIGYFRRQNNVKVMRILALLMLLVAPAPLLAQSDTPESAVAAFIIFSRSRPQDFNARGVEIRKPWFTPELYRHFLNELRREKAYLKQNPTDKPFYGDGVPFQPTDETCDAGKEHFRYSYTVGKGTVSGNIAEVPVSFIYPTQCQIPAIVYTFKMKKGKTAWLISDLDYNDGTTLVEDLNRAKY